MMVTIEASERIKLWGQYPEVQELFEEFNGARLDDDFAWNRVVARCHEIREIYHGSTIIEILLTDAALQLEKLAKKRSGYT